MYNVLLFKILNVIFADKRESVRSCLSEECQRNLHKAVTFTRSQADAIVEGNVSIGSLKMIKENENTFCDIVHEICEKEDKFSILVRKAIAIRLKEIDTFVQQAEQMRTFVDLCSHYPAG